MNRCGSFCPGLANELVRREAFESLEPFGKIVSAYEVREMTAIQEGHVSGNCTPVRPNGSV